MKKETQKAIGRLVVTAVLLINGYLAAKGHNPLPLDDAATGEFVSVLLAVVSYFWVWWKNNNVTVEACTAQCLCNEMKANKNKVTEKAEEPEDSEV